VGRQNIRRETATRRRTWVKPLGVLEGPDGSLSDGKWNPAMAAFSPIYHLVP
jgi:hypothetical protein